MVHAAPPEPPAHPSKPMRHRALPRVPTVTWADQSVPRSEEHTSELQSPCNLVCRLLLAVTATGTHTPALHDALPICGTSSSRARVQVAVMRRAYHRAGYLSYGSRCSTRATSSPFQADAPPGIAQSTHCHVGRPISAQIGRAHV